MTFACLFVCLFCLIKGSGGYKGPSTYVKSFGARKREEEKKNEQNLNNEDCVPLK